MSDDIIDLRMHFLMIQIFLSGRRDDSFCHRMGEMFLQTGCNAQHFVFFPAAEYDNVPYGRSRLCQRSRLIEHDRLRLGDGFQIFSALDGNMAGIGLPYGGQDGDGHRQLKRAGKVHHQNSQRFCDIAGKEPHQTGAGQSIRNEPVRQTLGFAFHTRFQPFRLLDHRHDFLVARGARGGADRDSQFSFLQDSAGIHISVRRLVNRQRFTCHRGLVDHSLSGCDDAVKRNDISHMHDHFISRADVGSGYQNLLLSFSVCIPLLQPHSADIQRHASGQVSHRFFMCPFLEDLTDPQQEHDRSRCIEIAPQQRNSYGGGIESLHFQFSAFQAADSPENITGGFHRNDGCSYRIRQEKFSSEAQDHLPDQFFPVFRIQFSSGMLDDAFRNLRIFKTIASQRPDHTLSVSRIEHHRIRCTLVNLRIFHFRQTLQIVQQRIRLFI